MLERLKRPIAFKQYLGLQDKTNENNDIVGQIPKYSDVVVERMGLSASRGTAESAIFGNLLDYDRTLTTKNLNCPMAENSIVWLDGADPEKGEPHNYIVLRKAITNNYIVYAVKRVEVS